MRLKDIIVTEEELLKVDSEFDALTNLDINEVILLTNVLTNLSNITNIYFGMLEQYGNKVEKMDCQYDVKVKMVEEYNEKMLNTDINLSKATYGVVTNFKIKKLMKLLKKHSKNDSTNLALY